MYSPYVRGYDRWCWGIGTVGAPLEVIVSSFSSSFLFDPDSLTLLHVLLGGCCPAQGVDLGCCCCGVIRIESNKEACSPNRFLLPGEFDRSTLTLLLLLVSVSLLSWFGGMLWLLWWVSLGLELGELSLPLSLSVWILSDFPGVPCRSAAFL